MGGRGASGSGKAGGQGGSGARVLGTRSLVSEREGSREAVDQVLNTLKSLYRRYGVDSPVEEAQIAKFDKRGDGIMAYYDAGNNIAINEKYFDPAKMDEAYDLCVQSGFHPSRGNKTGLEATTAHEMGHRLSALLGEKLGYGSWAVDRVSDEIVKEAAQKLGYGKDTQKLMDKVSGYGAQNTAETIAEAFADYYCNGSKAGRESKAIYNILYRRLRTL